jgi:type IV pilus assembly protein PilM
MGLFSKNAYGIDIGTQSVKIVELHKRGANAFEVANYAHWNDDLGDTVQSKGNSMSTDKVAGIISNMMKESGMKISEAYFAMPGFLSFSSVINLPKMSDAELAQAVPLEARQYIPVPMSDVQVDWINLGDNPTKDKTQVLIMAIPNSAIRRYTQIAQSLGIKIKGFELDIFSQIRSLELEPRNTCIVDIGARSSTVSIINENKELMMTRSFDVGGNQISTRISEVMNISMERAEQLKIDNGMVGDQGVASVIGGVIGAFIGDEVLRMLHEFNENREQKVEKVLICGGISRMKGVQDFVTQKLHSLDKNFIETEVAIAYPSNKLKVKGELYEEFVQNIWQDLSLAIGIALRQYM